MPDSLMYEEEMFVVLETNQPETFLTPDELFNKLREVLEVIQDDLPNDLKHIETIDEQAKKLMDTSCELDLGPDQFLQWYVVRMEK